MPNFIMAGNKNSGRKSNMKESIMKINLDLCDTIIHDFLLDKTIPLFEKAKTIMPLVTKKMPTKLEGDLNVSGIVISFNDGTKVEM